MAKKKEIIGFVLIKLPPDVHKNLKVLCAHEGDTIQSTVTQLIKKFVDIRLPEIQSSN